MPGSYKVTYNVDIVFCIDATESMKNVIDIVKENAIHFYSDVTKVMEEKGKTINRLRLRIVVFRDYLADGEDAMLVTDFFELPYESEGFDACIRSIRVFGGGDDPEDGLEALAFAMDSDWNQEGVKRRHVIAVWTDAPTHRIGFSRNAPEYPPEMMTSFEELSEWWGSIGSDEESRMDQSAKRLLLFAPDAPYWNTIAANWDSVIFHPSIAGNGLNEITYQQIINAISNTI